MNARANPEGLALLFTSLGQAGAALLHSVLQFLRHSVMLMKGGSVLAGPDVPDREPPTELSPGAEAAVVLGAGSMSPALLMTAVKPCVCEPPCEWPAEE